jgi:hypothetical protein
MERQSPVPPSGDEGDGDDRRDDSRRQQEQPVRFQRFGQEG